MVIDIRKAGQSGESNFILEEVEISRAMFEVYEGGVVRHALSKESRMLIAACSSCIKD